jgi:hypothetical protein
MVATFTVFYNDVDGNESSTDIEFDTTGYEWEDFAGGEGQDLINDIFDEQFPDCEWLYMEIPADAFEEAA